MTTALFDKLINPIPKGARWADPMVHFGATPYGDIFDPLRINTPKGPLPLKLLQNYKVLFAVGSQTIDDALAARLKEYVEQGGTLVLNIKQFKTSILDKTFTGIELAKGNKSATEVICTLDGEKLNSKKFTYTPLKNRDKCTILYKTANGDALVTRHKFGKGYVITTGAHWLLDDKSKILPIANNILKRLVKAVIPIDVTGKNVDDQVLYQINRKGDGWVISLYNNGGITYSANSPVTIWPSKKVNITLSAPKQTQDAVEWITHKKLAVNNGAINISIMPGDVKIIEIQPTEIKPIKVEEYKNLAIGSKVTASSYQAKGHRVRCDSTRVADRICAENTPEKAVNGNRDIYDALWSYTHADLKSKELPWLMVDLGEEKDIRSINTIYMWSENQNTLTRIYQYYIEISTDGKTWKKVIDETKNTSPANRRGTHRYFVENPLKARYVRITTTLASAHGGAQLVEFEIYGTEKIIKIYPWKK